MLGPIAQLDDAARSWPDFIRKASKGSHKAAECVIQADLAVAKRLGGRPLVEEADASDYDTVMGHALPDSPPFDSVQQLLDEAYANGLLTARSEPFRDHAHYERLWSRGHEVDPAQLLHDAALWCYQHWNGTTFRRLMGRVETAQLTYNSQDVVACMLYLSALPAQPR